MPTTISNAGVTFPNGTIQPKPMIGATSEYSATLLGGRTACIKIPKSDGTFWVIGGTNTGDTGVGQTAGQWSLAPYYPELTSIQAMCTQTEFNSDPNSTGVSPDTGGVGINLGLATSTLNTGSMRTTVSPTNTYWWIHGIFIGSSAV